MIRELTVRLCVSTSLARRCPACARESLPFRSPGESQPSGSSAFLLFCRFPANILLRHISLGQSHRKLPDPGNHSHPFSNGDRSSRIEEIKKMRTLETEFIRGEQRKTLLHIDGGILVGEKHVELIDQRLRFTLIHLKMLPGLLDVGFLKVVH